MIALGFMTLVSTVALAAILVRLDPMHVDSGTRAVLYLSVFTAMSGMASWILMATRALLPKTKRPLRYFFRDAFRQGLLVGGIVTASLILQAGRNLNIVWILVVVAVAFTIEAYMTRSALAK